MNTRKQPLILGIDPGTTTAVAILNINAKKIKLFSVKNPNPSQIIMEIIKNGEPIIMGTDKAATPLTVKKYANKLGAVIIKPAKDLEKIQKRTEDGDVKNDHEQDALAAARYAYSKAKPRLRQAIEFFDKAKIPLSAEILRYVLKDPKIHMQSVISKVSPPKPQAHQRKKTMNAPSTEAYSDSLKAADKYKRLLNQEKKQNKFQVQKLQSELKKIKSQTQNLDQIINKKVSKKTAVLKLEKKQLIIKARNVVKKNKKLLQELCAARKIIDLYQHLQVIPILQTSKRKECMNKAESVQHGSVIYADDASGFGNSLLKILKNKGVFILSTSKRSRVNSMNNICIDNLQIKIEFNGNIFVDKKSLNKEKRKFDMLSTVIEEYKQKRQAHDTKKEDRVSS